MLLCFVENLVEPRLAFRRVHGLHDALRGATTLRSVRDGREAQLEAKGLQKPIQRLLRRVVARVKCPQEIRARHSYPGRELLHAHRSNNLAKGHLKRNFLVDRCEQEFSGELWIPKILRQPNIPVLMSPSGGMPSLSGQVREANECR